MKDLKYGGKMYIILVYDIKNIGNYSLIERRIFKICKKYLYNVQNSVFEGILSKSQLEKLKLELSKYIRKDDDSLIIFKTLNNNWMEKEFLTNDRVENRQFI